MTDLDRIMNVMLKQMHEFSDQIRTTLLEGGASDYARYREMVGYLMGVEQVAQYLIEKAKEIEDAEEAD